MLFSDRGRQDYRADLICQRHFKSIPTLSRNKVACVDVATPSWRYKITFNNYIHKFVLHILNSHLKTYLAILILSLFHFSDVIGYAKLKTYINFIQICFFT